MTETRDQTGRFASPVPTPVPVPDEYRLDTQLDQKLCDLADTLLEFREQHPEITHDKAMTSLMGLLAESRVLYRREAERFGAMGQRRFSELRRRHLGEDYPTVTLKAGDVGYLLSQGSMLVCNEDGEHVRVRFTQ